ncbi:MAG: hypothetical protein IJV46_02935, partial [Acidaminococcaceae bacterium]|nr:hypothetical protein [Acidaminococcaceae bacterium]
MESDNSWNRSARAYADLYDKVAGVPVTAEPIPETQIAAVEEEILQAVKGEEITAEAEPVQEHVQQPVINAEAVVENKPEEAEKEPAKKKTAAKKTVKKAAGKTTAKKASAKKTAEPEAAEAAPVKKRAARKTAAKKTAEAKTEAVPAVTDETAAAAAPKKRGRKPGSKNKKKEE